MSITIPDIEGQRHLTIDASNQAHPGSVFLETCNGTCIEMDKSILLDALRAEAGSSVASLIEETDTFLAAIAA